MDPEARAWLRGAFAELEALLDPLTEVVGNPPQFYRLLQRIGWNLPGLLSESGDALVTALGAVATKARQTCDAADRDDVPQAVAAALAATRAAYEALHGFRALLTRRTVADLPTAVGEALTRDLVDHLCIVYLRRRWPTVAQAAMFFGVIVEETAQPVFHGSGAARLQLRHEVLRPATRLIKLLAFASDPLGTVLAGGGTLAATLEAATKGAEARLFALARELRASIMAGVSLTLGPTEIRLEGQQLPLVSSGHGGFDVALPLEQSPVVHITPTSLRVTWTPLDLLVGGEPLLEIAGLRLAAAGQPVAGAKPPGVTLRHDADGCAITLTGGVTICLPQDRFATAAGGRVDAGAYGKLTLVAGSAPVLVIDETRFGIEALALGGPGGLLLKRASVAIAGLRWPVPSGPPQFTVRVEGALALTAASAEISLAARLAAAAIQVESSGFCNLGGVRLHPVDGGTPVLSGTVAPMAGGARFELAVAGAIDVPHELGLRRATLLGTIRFTATRAGASVDQVAVSAALGMWRLPGGITLANASAALTLSGGRVLATVSGGLGLAGFATTAGAQLSATLDTETTDPTNIHLSGVAERVTLSVGDKLRVFDTTVRVSVRSHAVANEPVLTLEQGTAGLFQKGAASASTADYQLAVEQLGASLTPKSGGFDLSFTAGRLLLPDIFSKAGDTAVRTRPAVGVTDAGLRLEIRDSLTQPFSAFGSVLLENFRVALPGTTTAACEAVLQTAKLSLQGAELAKLVSARGLLRLPLPNGRALALSFGADGLATWSLAGLPVPGLWIELDADAVLDLGADLQVALLGKTAPIDQLRTRFSIQASPGGGAPLVSIRAGVEVRLPLSAITQHNGDRVTARAGATLSGRVGEAPLISGLALTFRPETCFKLGGAGGIAVHGQISGRSLENLLDPAPSRPVLFGLSGEIRVSPGDNQDAVGVGLENAVLEFRGPDAVPGFSFSGARVETGIVRRLSGIPFRLMNPSIRFKKTPPLPFPACFAVANVELGFSLEAGIPLADGMPSVNARADGVTVGFKPNGLPDALSISGIGLGVKDLDLGVMTIDALLYAGGLPQSGALIDASNPPLPPFFAGKGGGKVSGAGVKTLLAFGRPERSGVALDGSAGPSGIVLGQTGFTINGAAGGISFANSTRDPTDIASYIDGAGRPGSADMPPPTRRPADEPAPATPEAIESAAQFPCPGQDCPPPSVNIFCQPHPRNRNRVILKFTSLGEQDLQRLGLRRAEVNARCPAAPSLDEVIALATDLVNAVHGRVIAQWIAPPDAVRRRLDMARASMIAWAAARLKEQLAAVPATPYDALLFVAELGLPCPDVTLQVTGTASHLAVAYFLTITGGFRISSAGAVGMVGSLNIFGIPVGKVWGFVTATDDQGNPDLSMCGVVRAAVGPLELGTLRLSLACSGCTVGMAEIVRGFAVKLGATLARDIVDEVAPAVIGAGERASRTALTASALFARLDEAQLLGVLSGLYRRPLNAKLRECLVQLVRELWNRFNPVLLLCGQVRPQFLGIAILPEAVAARAHVTKEQFAVQFGFAPSLLLTVLIDPRYLPPFDSADVGLRIKFPPAIAVDLLLNSDDGRSLSDAESAKKLAAKAFDEFLATLTIAGKYVLAPLGMKLLQAETRLMMPDLLNHPDRPGAPAWAPRPLAERMALLVAAVGERLGNPLWRGSAGELAQLALPFATDGRDLRAYFPHGGMAGACRLPIPKLLHAAPDLKLLGEIASNATPIMARLMKVMEFIDKYLAAAPESNGGLAFYVPAPTPAFVKPGGAPNTPREMLESMMAFDLDIAAMVQAPKYRIDLAFFRGWLQGQLLGVPLGDATIDLQPISDRARTGGHLRVTAKLPPGSWLCALIADTALIFIVAAAPSRAFLDNTLATVRKRAADLAAAPSTNAAAVQAVAADLARSLATDAPKVSLELRVRMQMLAAANPAGLLSLAQASAANATLCAYSVAFAPDQAGAGPIAAAKRSGGIALRVDSLQIGAALGLDIALPSAELSVTQGAGGRPVVRGHFEAVPIGLPRAAGASRLQIGGATLDIDTQPDAGRPCLAATGAIPEMTLAPGFRILPDGPGPLDMRLAVMPSATAAAVLAVSIAAARLQVGGLVGGASVARLHGDSPGSRFSFSSTGTWSATLTLGPFELADAAGNKCLRVGSPGQSLSGRLDAIGVTAATLAIDVPAGVSVTAFPDTPQAFVLAALPNVALRVVVGSNGSFSVEGTAAALKLGVFTVCGAGGIGDPLRLALTQSALSVQAGAKLVMAGAAGLATLAQFTMSSDGNFVASIDNATLALGGPDLFSASVKRGKLQRLGGVTKLAITEASVSLFRDPYRVDIATAQFYVDSTGAFTCDSGSRTISVPQLLSVTGSLRFGIASSSGPYARVEAAQILLTPIGATVAAATVVISSKQINADIGAWHTELPSIFKLSVAQSTLTYAAGAAELAIKPGQMSLTAFGSTATVQLPQSITLRANGVHAVLQVAGAALTFPGASIALNQCALAPDSLVAAGTATSLGGILSGNALIIASGLPWAATVTLLAKKTLVTAGAATVEAPAGTGTLALGRNINGIAWATLNASASLLGGTRAVSAALGSGSVSLAFSDQRAFTVGPFSFKPGGGTVSFRPGDAASVRVSLNNLAVGSSSVDGWSAAAGAALTFGPSAAFSLTPQQVKFAGMAFGSACTISRNETGVTTAASSDSVDAHGASLTRKMTVASNGSISGRLGGSFKWTFSVDPPRVGVFDPPAFDKTVDFGSVDIGFNASTRRFEKTLDRDGFRFDFSWP